MAVSNQENKPSIITNVQNGWNNLPKARKMIVGGSVLFAILGLLLYAVLFSKKEYVTLYSNLDLETAGEIKVSLEESGVTDYKVGEGGTSILVLKNQVDQLRMDLAVNGLTPESGTGFELFDTSQMGVTETERQIMYQRALEGELRRSIMSLDAVNDARIHLNINEDSVFSRETDPSTASVVLDLKSSKALTESQVQGIVALVSGAVDNLTPANIQVIDTNGNLLSRGLDDSNYNYQSGELIQQEMQYELHLEEKVQAQLGKVLGYDKIAVSVRVTLDNSSQEQRSEEYSEGPKVSDQTQFNRTENGTGETPDGGGPLDNNLGTNIESGGGNVEDALADSTITDFNQTNNYQPNVTETHTLNPPGTLKTLSVSVIYDGELDNNLSAVITNHVISIVGLDVVRGDTIAVTGVPFNLPNLDIDGNNDNQTAIINDPIMRYIVIGIIGLIGLLIIVSLVGKFGRKKTIEPSYEPVGVGNTMNSLYDMDLKEHIPPKPEEKEVALVDKITDIFKNNQEKAIEVLKIWIHDEGASSERSSIALDGLEKAASLLVVLGKELATATLKQLEKEEVVRLAQMISTISVIPNWQANSLIEEFLKLFEAKEYMSQGGFEFAQEALKNAMGAEGAEDVLKKVKATPKKRPFEAIRRMDTTQLLNVLMSEHPQTIALVLCYLPAEKSASIISELPAEIQAEVTQRIGLMKHASSQVVEAVEGVIESRLQNFMSGDMTQLGGLKTVVSILNSVDRSTQKNIIDSMFEENEKFAEEVRDNLFTFEDIIRLDKVAVQRVLRELESTTIAVALKGAGDEIINMIMKNMSARASERLKEEIDYLGPVRLAEVEKAQHEIVLVIRRLEDEGEIIINQSGENDVVY